MDSSVTAAPLPQPCRPPRHSLNILSKLLSRTFAHLGPLPATPHASAAPSLHPPHLCAEETPLARPALTPAHHPTGPTSPLGASRHNTTQHNTTQHSILFIELGCSLSPGLTPQFLEGRDSCPFWLLLTQGILKTGHLSFSPIPTTSLLWAEGMNR